MISQLEAWCVSEERKMTEYVTGASTLQAAFSLDGSHIIACWDYDCGVVLLDVNSGKVGGTC